MIEIELNGAPHAIAENHNVQDLMTSLNLVGQAVAVAVNREIVPRRAWHARVLRPNDRVNIVRAVGGG